ncbi:MAG: flavin-containing monooxygenase, partial [Streptomyces sp.]|uniref:flavin-containing monooxygenase n=1 Tax=Streptomyces sp. TaxID=1931 RepID=UPI003D6B425E
PPHHLTEQGLRFVVLEAAERIGQSWRSRWDSLNLFTPAPFSHLPGMACAAGSGRYQTKDELAEYLEAYAARFRLPVRLGCGVERLTRHDGQYLLTAGDHKVAAPHVVVATGAFGAPFMPEFANALDPSIMQLHSSDYRNPDQLADGPVLVVGAGNSGAEIALETAGRHETWLAGRDTGYVPFHMGTLTYRMMTKIPVNRWPGRAIAAAGTGRGHPLISVSPDDLSRVGVRRVPRVESADGGRPVLADGICLDVANVIWSTGYVPDYTWVDLPAFEPHHHPPTHRGVVCGEPGLYLLGLPFQATVASHLIGGVGKDAAYVVRRIVARSRSEAGAERRRRSPSDATAQH